MNAPRTKKRQSIWKHYRNDTWYSRNQGSEICKPTAIFSACILCMHIARGCTTPEKRETIKHLTWHTNEQKHSEITSNCLFSKFHYPCCYFTGMQHVPVLIPTAIRWNERQGQCWVKVAFSTNNMDIQLMQTKVLLDRYVHPHGRWFYMTVLNWFTFPSPFQRKIY